MEFWKVYSSDGANRGGGLGCSARMGGDSMAGGSIGWCNLVCFKTPQLDWLRGFCVGVLWG